MERLQKAIAASGYCSRRKAEELITAGKVFVNGKKVMELGTKVKPSDDIVVEGAKLSSEEKEYYILNKPAKTVSTTNDEKNRANVCDLIETAARIYPVGRLDYDTTGLLILTNDGEFANLLMHPSNGIEKTYVAKIEGILDMADYFKIKNGIVIEDIKTIPKRLKIRKKDKQKNATTVEITIMEGRNHIVKKIFEFLGYKVIKLNRVQYDFLTLEGLPTGTYRPLTPKEVKKLYVSANKN